MRLIIDTYCSFNDILEDNGLEPREINVNILCPFHDNKNTPSARIYRDNNGETLYCYSEQRLYKPSALITKKVVDETLVKRFMLVYPRLSKSERNISSEMFEKVDQERLKLIDNTDFKEGRISCKEFLDYIRDRIDKDDTPDEYIFEDDVFSKEVESSNSIETIEFENDAFS